MSQTKAAAHKPVEPQTPEKPDRRSCPTCSADTSKSKYTHTEHRAYPGKDGQAVVETHHVFQCGSCDFEFGQYDPERSSENAPSSDFVERYAK